MEALLIILLVYAHAAPILRNIRVYGGLGWTVGSYYAPLVLIGYAVIVTALIISALVALGGHHTRAFAVICFISMLVIWAFQGLIQNVAGVVRSTARFAAGTVSPRLAATIGPGREPSISSVLIIIPGFAAVMALGFPLVFMTVYGWLFLGGLIAGITIVVAWPSDKVRSTKILAGLTAATFALWMLCFFCPAHVRAMAISRNVNQAHKGRQNIIDELQQRPDQKITSEKAVTVWRVVGDGADDELGSVSTCPEIAEGGIKPDGNAIATLPKDTKFRVADIEASTIECGEQLIKIYLPAADGTWVQPNGFGNMYIAVSQTDLVTKSSPEPTPTSGSGGSGGDQFTLSASASTLRTVAVKKGQLVTISADGQASAASSSDDGAYKFVGPNGWGSDPWFNSGRKGPLSRGSSFMALAVRVSSHEPSITDGGWTEAGTQMSFRAKTGGYVYFTVNDPPMDASGFHPSWRQDNEGGYNIRVKVG